MSPKCGLCGSKEKLTVTECCNNLICDDEEEYVLFSFALNSCYRNHRRYTLCAYHYNEKHKAPDWRTCKECLDEFGPNSDFADDTFNFKEKTKECKQCHQDIKIKKEDYVRKGGHYYCLKCYSNEPQPPQTAESGNQVQPDPQDVTQSQAHPNELERAQVQQTQQIASQSEKNPNQTEENKAAESKSEAAETDKTEKKAASKDKPVLEEQHQQRKSMMSSSQRGPEADPHQKKSPAEQAEGEEDQEKTNESKYGKRKCNTNADEDEDEDGDGNSQGSSEKVKKKRVKKNQDEEEFKTGRKSIQIFGEKRTTRLSVSKLKESGVEGENDDRNEVRKGERSTSAYKDKPKKIVKGKKKDV